MGTEQLKAHKRAGRAFGFASQHRKNKTRPTNQSFSKISPSAWDYGLSWIHFHSSENAGLAHCASILIFYGEVS